MNKKLLMFGIPILAMALVAAAIFISYVKVDATVSEALSVSTVDMDLSGYAGETITKSILIENKANVPINALLTWEERKNNYLLDNLLGACEPYPSTTCEKRITIESGMSLDDLDSISWDTKVLGGYLPHVDVFLDNGEVLVFEYAKVNPASCDITPYPTGELNTFGTNGIVDSNAKAWLSAGPAGPCGDSTFELGYKTLSNWKVFYPTANVLRFEIEVDNWISPSSSKVSHILINGEETTAMGVTYTTNLPQTISLPTGITNVPIEFTYNGDSPVGTVSGRITIERVA